MEGPRSQSLMILVAGPYRSGTNDDPALEAAGSAKVGDAIFNEIFHPIAHRILERCDAGLRIGGPSQGADELVRSAQAQGKQVFHRWEDVPGCR